MAGITKQDVISFIEKMTVLDLAELVKELEGILPEVEAQLAGVRS